MEGDTVRHLGIALGTIALSFGMAVAGGQAASADPPGPGDKQCSPGQNNVGGGPGNSGPGDKNGAPHKAPSSCPGG